MHPCPRVCAGLQKCADPERVSLGCRGSVQFANWPCQPKGKLLAFSLPSHCVLEAKGKAVLSWRGSGGGGCLCVGHASTRPLAWPMNESRGERK